MKKFLYVCEADSGGIMEYAIRQSSAIAREGVEVHFLCKPSFPVERLAAGIKVWEFDKSRAQSDQCRGLAGKIFRVWQMIADLRSEAKHVAKLVINLAQDKSTQHQLTATREHLGPAEVFVLFACYKEYFAPFWVGPLRKLAKKGVVVGTIAHDPVRDFVVGPLLWHRWSVRLGYSFVRDVFVHDVTPVDFGGKKPEGILIHQIPHGPYEVAEPKIGRMAMRSRLVFDSGLTAVGTECSGEECKGVSHGGTANTEQADAEAWHIEKSEKLKKTAAFSPVTNHPLLATPASPDVVFLAFGQIRDGKNLDLFLRAMTRLPENVKLLVAGKGDSGSSRPPEYYQKLAEELGVGDRCRWDIRRIPDEEVGDLFAASDVVLVTYSAKFRSASGVLNAAVSARKPVLASSGLGPLRTVVEKCHLGVFVEPDNPEEVLRGSKQLMDALAAPAFSCHSVDTPTPLESAWDRYESENSWEVNAKVIVQNLG